MSREQRSLSSSSSSSNGPPESPLCIVCDEATAGVGPFSRHHLCLQHLRVDEDQVRSYKVHVDPKLSVYSQQLTSMREALQQQHEAINRLKQRLDETIKELKRQLDEFVSRVVGELTARQEAVLACVRDLDDISSYKQEVACAEESGKLAQVLDIAMSMDMSLGDLEADFSLNERLEGESDDGEVVERLLKLERSVSSCVGVAEQWGSDAGVTARPETRDVGCPDPMVDPFMKSHEIQCDGLVLWVAVSNDTSGFFANPSGHVVSGESPCEGSVALPTTCMFVVLSRTKYFLALSADGSVKLRCHCDINWKNDIRGLHCDRQQLFIAQNDAVTVTDLSGRVIRQLRPPSDSFDSINGIGGNAASVFVSGGNKIAAFSKATGQMETVITLSQLPGAALCNLGIHDNCILVTDRKHNQVHRVRMDTQQLVTSHPTQRAGLTEFSLPCDVAVDRRGRLFVSEPFGHSVRVVSAEEGSLLWTLGVPGESGSGEDRLCHPLGLAVVMDDLCETLVVVDGTNDCWFSIYNCYDGPIWVILYCYGFLCTFL